MLKRLVIFLILNFGGLYLGSIYTSVGTSSDWYTSLPKAPWTPPGWVFGFAWTLIMICFSVYLAFAFGKKNNLKKLAVLFGISWVLNVSWNPVFFYFHETVYGLVVISVLTIVIWIMLIYFRNIMKTKTLLLLPYGMWLLIATSLNLYIVLNT